MQDVAGRREDARPPTPWVFASPHSGTTVPPDMRPAPGLSRRSLRSAEDALVDRLIASGASRGAALLLGDVSRAYVDLNRAPDELDPDLIDGVDAGAPVSPRAAAGYGVIPRLSGDGHALNAARLTRAEADARVAAWHAPYHARLTELMQSARAAHGRAILIDWHSMPATRDAGAPRVVVGDRHGESCAPELSRRVQGLFEAEGWRTALNVPYAGGWSTQRWGRPSEGFHAVQIELDRGLYLDAGALRPGAGWARCTAGVERVIAALLAG
ncbi:MAG TPA: N-formylglutamate amidohydrolase [Brevundimonas sp.]|uniref:N-formylglutamate amidohydrolase n=1 Tax=Brevundimonas sp. TaxID=1871086 RepID=UPI002DF24B8C|nr:N-formylglutamate amidohydrolase [Brevundimonas sp.]